MDVVQPAGGSAEAHAEVGRRGVGEVQTGKHVVDRAAGLAQADGDAISARSIGYQQHARPVRGRADRGGGRIDAARCRGAAHIDVVGAEGTPYDHAVGRRTRASAQGRAPAHHAGQLAGEIPELVQADAQITAGSAAIAQTGTRQCAGHRLVGVVQIEADAVRARAAPGHVVEFDDHALAGWERSAGIACAADLAGEIGRQSQPAVAHRVIGVVAVGDQATATGQDATVVVAGIVVARERPPRFTVVAEGGVDLELRTRRKRESCAQCREQRNKNYL